MRCADHLIALATVFLCLAAGNPPPTTQPATAPAREKIGESFGRAIYRDEIRTDPNETLADELHRLFSAPAVARYAVENKQLLEPTPEELRKTIAWFRRQEAADRERRRAELEEINAKLADPNVRAAAREHFESRKSQVESMLEPPDDPAAAEAALESFADWWLRRWKFNRHLYDRHGGGRILWQQFGLEAFDAHKKWLEHFEARGDFHITDPELRAAFYNYWNVDHGRLASDKPEHIKEFLEPESLKD
jgi:hypothetical protein